jgi:hypothetical protein
MRQYFSASGSSTIDNANDGTIKNDTFYSTGDSDSDSHPSKQGVQQRQKQLPLTHFARVTGKPGSTSTPTQCTPEPASISAQCTQRKRRRLDDWGTHDDESSVLDKSSPPAAHSDSDSEWALMGGNPDGNSNINDDRGATLVGRHEVGHGQFIHACVQYQVEGLSDHLTGKQYVLRVHIVCTLLDTLLT